MVTLKVPPLREHLEDLPLLVEHFAAAAGGDRGAAEVLAAPMLAELSRHRWPGNVRELRNLVEATVLMGEPPPLETDRDPAGPQPSGTIIDVAPWLSRPYTEAKDLVAEQFELQYFRVLLEACGGSVAKAAEAAGIHRTYLTRLLKRRGIKLQRSLLY